MQSQNLYFLAIIPDGKVAGEVTVLKEHIAVHYNSRKALKVMPHITLKAPFRHTLQDEVVGWFNHLNLKTNSFVQTLNGFGSFSNPNNPVIFITPVASPPLLALQQEIATAFTQAFATTPLHDTEQHFSPHMTIAYRDLSFEDFEKAWQEFKDRHFFAQFTVNTVALLQHNGTQWHVIAEKVL